MSLALRAALVWRGTIVSERICPDGPLLVGDSPTAHFNAPLPGDEVVPFTRRRRLIAEHMVYSKHTSPHVFCLAEIDMHKVDAARKASAKAGKPVDEYCAEMHAVQAAIARGFALSFDHFGRSSSAENRVLTQGIRRPKSVIIATAKRTIWLLPR